MQSLQPSLLLQCALSVKPVHLCLREHWACLQPAASFSHSHNRHVLQRESRTWKSSAK